jgi:hypothetical protein
VPPIYRAPMRSRTLDVPAGAGAEFGVEHGVVGIGEGSSDKDRRMIARLAELPDGTFVWARTTDGAFRLGRIAGPQRRDDSERAREVGIVHVRATAWLDRPFAPDEVPPAVGATFARGGRNLQRIHGAAAEARTAELWSAHEPHTTRERR